MTHSRNVLATAFALLAPLQAAPLDAATPRATTPGSASSAGASLGAYEGAPVADGRRITGRVVVKDLAPGGPALPVTRNEKVCGTSIPDERLLVGSDGGVCNTVVTLEGILRGKPVDVNARATLERRSCAFVPHVQTLVVNQVLEVRNSDPLPQTTRALLNGEEVVFSLSLPIQNQAVRQKMKTSGVLHLQSDDADWMSGYLVVTPNPYAAVTDREGRFTLDDVPPGTYTLRFWHEALGNRQSEVTVPVGSDAAVTLQFDHR